MRFLLELFKIFGKVLDRLSPFANRALRNLKDVSTKGLKPTQANKVTRGFGPRQGSAPASRGLKPESPRQAPNHKALDREGDRLLRERLGRQSESGQTVRAAAQKEGQNLKRNEVSYKPGEQSVSAPPRQSANNTGGQQSRQLEIPPPGRGHER